MGTGFRGGRAARQVRALLDAGATGSLEDGELLGRFLGRDDSAESAFAALVDRHGGMVLRVCLDVLGDPHDAQDAAQATFFILARKAAAIRRPEALPSWLHGTARRVASRALRESIRRRRHERRAAETASTDPGSGEERRHDWSELHEELARLPDRYREPIVLCDLAGLTHGEAAGKLGCPPRTLETRLYRGRERLKDRLVRRGVAPSATLVGRPWATAARASVSEHWVILTADAAVRHAGKGSWVVAGEVPATAVRWAREHWKEMVMIKLKWVAAAGVLIGVAGGAWSRMASEGGGRRDARAVDAPPGAVEAPAPSKPKDAFERAYALVDGEDVKLLTGPAIEARNEHYKGQWDKIGMGFDPVERKITIASCYRWRDGTPVWTSASTDPPKLRDLFGMLVGVSAPEVEGDPALLATPVPADFLTREGAPAGRIIAQLETILRRDFRLPVRLSLRDEARDVVVARGHYRYQAGSFPPEFPERLASGSDRIAVYARGSGEAYDLRQDHFSGGADFAGLLSDVGLFLGRRVIAEVEERPNTRFDYGIKGYRLKLEPSPEDRALILKHLAEQTGYTFREESRSVRILRVDRAE